MSSPQSNFGDSSSVQLHIYDLTKGVAAVMSPVIIGRKIDGVWHTGVVVYGREYFYGTEGIQTVAPGGTLLGAPLRVEHLGETHIPYTVFLDYILQLGDSKFRGASYELFSHNCNNFSEDLSQFLVGKSVPKYILDLPEQVLSTPFGQSLRPLIHSLVHGPNIETIENRRDRNIFQSIVSTIRPNENGGSTRPVRDPSPDFVDLNTQIEEARLQSIAREERRKTLNEKIARKEKKKEKKRKKHSKHLTSQSSGSESNTTGYPNNSMSEAEALEVNGAGANGAGDSPAVDQLPSERALEQEAEERREAEEKKRSRDPPVVYKDAVDVAIEFDALVGLVGGRLSPEEQTALEELHQYMLEDEGSWALGDGFLSFVGRLLHDKSLPDEVRVRLLKVLAAAALKDDVILLLHQDRREHVLMNYAQDIDRHSPDEQQALALFICNLFENLSSSEWLLYISEWAYNGQQISNIRATTKVAVHCLLSDAYDVLQDRGSAIVHNLACKEVKTVVFDDVAVELTMAVLQFFSTKRSEDHVFRCMKALARFCQISGQDVPQLIQMIGPSPSTFKGISPRVDELIVQISKKLR